MEGNKLNFWIEYLSRHLQLQGVYRRLLDVDLASTLATCISPVFDVDEMKRSDAEIEAAYNKAKSGWKRDPQQVLSELEELFEDIESNGNLNGQRKCVHCEDVIRWGQYHVLCDGIENAQNYLSVFFRNVFRQKWVPVLTRNNQELCEESEYFVRNKKWIVPLRYRIHYTVWRLNRDCVLSNPLGHAPFGHDNPFMDFEQERYTWPLEITVFKAALPEVLQSMNQDFNIRIPVKWVFQDMFASYIIRRESPDFFEVRGKYRPSQVLGKDQFVLRWMSEE